MKPIKNILYLKRSFATQIRPDKVTRRVEKEVENATVPNANPDTMFFNDTAKDLVLTNISEKFNRFDYYDDPHSPDATIDEQPERKSRFLRPGETHDDVRKRIEQQRYNSPEYKAEMLFRKASMLEIENQFYDGVANKFFKEYCQKPLIELMSKNPNATPETLIPQAMDIILAESEKLLLIDMKGLHPLKDMIQLGHIDRGAVLRSVFTEGGILTYRVSRNGLTLSEPAHDANWNRYIRILERVHDRDLLRTTFDRFIKHRYQDEWRTQQGRFTLGLIDDYINREIRDPLVEKLATQTVYDTVTDRYLMFPVPDMAAISQTRRGIKNKIYDKETNTYYGVKDKPYSLWFPYLGILNLLAVYPETAEEDIVRLAVEKGLHLGVKDDGHGNIVYKEDIGRVIEHDWGFEARMYAVFREGELQASLPTKMSPQEQRELINKTFQLFTRAMGKDKIVQKSTVEFYASCYDMLRATILAHPNKGIDELWHYVMQPMRDKGYALLHTNLYNRHPIKNFVFRCFYYFQEVLRIPSPALKEDMYWPTLEGKVPFEYKNEPFWVLFKKMHDDLLSKEELVYWVYREKVMRNVNDSKRALDNKKPLGVPQNIQDDYVDDHVRKLMTNMHTDMLPAVGILLQPDQHLFINGFDAINEHSRRGVKNPQGYEGARYGLVVGFLTELILMMNKDSFQRYIENSAEESRHWDKGDEYEHGIYETARDFDLKIEHASEFQAYVSAITTIAESLIRTMSTMKAYSRNDRLEIFQALLFGTEVLKLHLDSSGIVLRMKEKLLRNNVLTWDQAEMIIAPIIQDAYKRTLTYIGWGNDKLSDLSQPIGKFFYIIYYDFIQNMCGKGNTLPPDIAVQKFNQSIVSKLTKKDYGTPSWRFNWNRQDYVESVYKVIFIHEERYLKRTNFQSINPDWNK